MCPTPAPSTTMRCGREGARGASTTRTGADDGTDDADGCSPRCVPCSIAFEAPLLATRPPTSSAAAPTPPATPPAATPFPMRTPVNTRSAVFPATAPPPEPVRGLGRAGRPPEPPEGRGGAGGAAGARVAVSVPMSAAAPPAPCPTRVRERASTVLSGRRSAAAATVETALMAAIVFTPSRSARPPLVNPYWDSCCASDRPAFLPSASHG